MNKNELNYRLQELAEEIKKIASPKTTKGIRKKRKLSGEFWELLINHPHLPYVKNSLYNEHYSKLQKRFSNCFEETLNQVGLEILEKIDNYESGKPVWPWFRFVLEKRFLDIKNDYLNLKKRLKQGKRILITHKSIYAPISKSSENNGESLTYLDLLGTKTQEIPLSRQLIDILEEDELKIFQNHHIKNQPQANYRYIALARANDIDWKQIAEEINVSIGTITPFMTRSHQYLKPILSEYLLGEVRISKAVQDVIIRDTDNKMKSEYYPNRQKYITNFQTVILYKINQKLTWQRIYHDELKLQEKNYYPLVNFYLKSIHKFQNIFDRQFLLDEDNF